MGVRVSLTSPPAASPCRTTAPRSLCRPADVSREDTISYCRLSRRARIASITATLSRRELHTVEISSRYVRRSPFRLSLPSALRSEGTTTNLQRAHGLVQTRRAGVLHCG